MSSASGKCECVDWQVVSDEVVPGLVVGTSTAGCAISARAYVDRMFGTLAFLTESVSPSCTGD